MLPKNKGFILVLPALTLIVLLFWGGLIYGVLQSFGLFSLTGDSSFNLDSYVKIFMSDSILESLLFTLRFAVISTLLSGIAAFLFLLLIFLSDRGNCHKRSNLLKQIFTTPMLIPYIVSGYLISILFMQSGWFSSILYNIGVIKNISDFPIITNDNQGVGIILTYIWKTSPFIVMICYPVIIRVQNKWVEAAKVFGASKIKFFFEVVFPLTLPSFIIALFIVFAFVFSAFEVPYLLGVTHPKSLSVLSYTIYSTGDITERADAMALNILITLITIGIGLITYYINKKYVAKKVIGWS